MAKANSTRGTSTTSAPASLSEMAVELNDFGVLLAGVEQICDVEDIGGDALHVAAATCRKINENICKIADRLQALDREGGAA